MNRQVIKVRNVTFRNISGSLGSMDGVFEVVRTADKKGLLTSPKAIDRARTHRNAIRNDDGLIEVVFEERILPKVGTNEFLAVCEMCSRLSKGEEPKLDDFSQRTIDALTTKGLVNCTKTRNRVMPTNDGFRLVKGLAPVPMGV